MKLMKLIDGDKTIAEIERFKKEEGWCQVGKDTADVYYARGFRFACERILNVLDASEVKEIDLKKEYDNEFFKDPVFGKLVNRSAGIVIAKHFFELGLKAQKGE